MFCAVEAGALAGLFHLRRREAARLGRRAVMVTFNPGDLPRIDRVENLAFDEVARTVRALFSFAPLSSSDSSRRRWHGNGAGHHQNPMNKHLSAATLWRLSKPPFQRVVFAIACIGAGTDRSTIHYRSLLTAAHGQGRPSWRVHD
jgi:hypothetical protein